MVNVGVVGGTIGVATDRRGHYQLNINSGDSVRIRFSFTGYDSYETVVALRGDRELNVKLLQAAKSLETIEITDEKTRQSSFTQIDVQKLDDAVGPAGGVESILKTLPDVNSSNELSSQYSVRGGSFDENLVYINEVEVFRPMLVRSGQQEGMSIINPDMVDYILFSPGGFDASYGDKMSSVLDITYKRPNAFSGKASVSLLGAAATVMGTAKEKLSYAIGFRQHSNSYILSSLDTRGSYSTSYTDFQSIVKYKINDHLDVGALAILTRNVYGLVPESQTTAFGGFMHAMQLDIYFDGAEEDKNRTALGAAQFDYHPDGDWRLRGNISVQGMSESERYDVQSQYWLYELGMGEQVGEVERFDRGVGTFLEHARNRLSSRIVSFNLKATRQAHLGQIDMGIGLQAESVADRLREWRLVDSAGYALPTTWQVPGDSNNAPTSPILQQYSNSNCSMMTYRATGFVQREVNLSLDNGTELKLLAGVRGSLYNARFDWYDVPQNTGLRGTYSPRLSASIKPHWERDIMFKVATGLYQQSPFYREYRREDGSINIEAMPQKSYQVQGTADWNFRLWKRPFKLTADVYYKYITDLIPYTVDNLRVSYHPDQEAVAYAVGASLRINGEFVDGLESWTSISLMRTQEDVVGDDMGWIDRPTDQRFSIKVFLQDYIPDMPWWRMSMSFIYATGMPITSPYKKLENPLRLPSYLRLDWGNTVQLSRFESVRKWKIFNYIDDLQVGLEVFNLFNFRNVVSYLWVADYEGRPYRVPNYLTARQINLKLTVLF